MLARGKFEEWEADVTGLKSVRLGLVIIIENIRLTGVVIEHCDNIMPDAIPQGVDAVFVEDTRKKRRVFIRNAAWFKPVVIHEKGYGWTLFIRLDVFVKATDHHIAVCARSIATGIGSIIVDATKAIVVGYITRDDEAEGKESVLHFYLALIQNTLLKIEGEFGAPVIPKGRHS